MLGPVTRLVLALSLLAACSSPEPPMSQASVETLKQAVIYGEDDRTDWYAEQNAPLKALTAASICAMVDAGDIDASDPDDVKLFGAPYGQAYDLCPEQPFQNQPTVAGCSATLIDDDLIITAGHCVNQFNCSGKRYVFDFHMVNPNKLSVITSDDVYRCSEVLAWANQGDADYAIARLDRAVVGHTPAGVGPSTPIPTDTPLWMVGYGSGLPAKSDDGGVVVWSGDGQAPLRMRGTVDAFGGNSGSGVFDDHGDLIGILVGGLQDYEYTGEGCQVANVVPEDDEGEQIVYAARAIEKLCATNYASARLCPENVGRWCQPCQATSDCAEDDGFACGPIVAGSQLSRCGATCQSDEGCRDDHECSDAGVCVAKWVPYCDGQAVRLTSGCGIDGGLIEECAGQQVCADGACVDRPEGDTCSNPLVLSAESQVITGSWTGGWQSDHVSQGCGGEGQDVVYQLDLMEDMLLVAVASGDDPVLHLRAGSACSGEGAFQISCNDDHPDYEDHEARLEELLEPGTYWLLLDGWEQLSGDFTLDIQLVTACAATCTAEDVRCGPGSVQTCVLDEEGCTWWQDSTVCADGEVCYGLQCVTQAPGDTCEDAIEIDPVSQSLSFELSEFVGGDELGTCAGEGRDIIHVMHITEPVRVTATLLGFDNVLHARLGACGDVGDEVACVDDSFGQGSGSRITVEVSEPGALYFISDAWAGDATGDVELALEVSCLTACEPDETRCTSAGVERCLAAPDGASCASWSIETPCAANEVCADFVCVERVPGDLCAGAIVLPPVSGVVEGDLTTGAGARADYEGTCGGKGADLVYSLEILEPTLLTALITGFDTVLHLRQGECEAQSAEISCDDDTQGVPNDGSYLQTSLQPGTYYLLVDAFEEPGAFSLDINAERECDAVCEVGAGRCLDNGGVERCEHGQDTCPAWVAGEPCGAGSECVDGVCRSPAPGDLCAAPQQLAGGLVFGALGTDYGDDAAFGCGDAGPERFYRLDLDETARAKVSIGGATELRVAVLSGDDCSDNSEPLACVGPDEPATLDLEAGTYVFVVERGAPPTGGAADGYGLVVDLSDIVPGCPPCGDEQVCVDGACVDRPEGNSCGTAIALEAATQVVAGVESRGLLTDAVTPSCDAGGVDRLYTLELTDPKVLAASFLLGDGAVHLRRDSCASADAERVCAATGGFEGETLKPGTYWLAVETPKPFALQLTFADPPSLVAEPDPTDLGGPQTDAGAEPDAAPQGDTGPQPDGVTSAETETTGASDPENPTDKGTTEGEVAGGGCSTTGTQPGAPIALLPVALLLLMGARRRRPGALPA